MKTRFGFLRRVWALALCAWVMMMLGGQWAWAYVAGQDPACLKAIERSDAMNIGCQLPRGFMLSLYTTEGGIEKGRGDNGYGHGCMQIDSDWHRPYIDQGTWNQADSNINYARTGGGLLCDTVKTLQARGVPVTCESLAGTYNSGTADPSQWTGTTKAHVGCTCGGAYAQYVDPRRACLYGGGVLAAAVLALDKINDVGTGVIQALAKVIETAVVLFDDHLGPGLLSVVMVIYSIMALWAIAKLLMPFGRPGNAGQTMNGLLTLTGTVGIVALMLSNLSLLTSLVFFPIMSLMTELGDLSTGTFQSTATISSECKTAQGQSMSGDAGKDAKLLATRMTCTVDQSMQPLKQTLRISMASLKRLEGNFNDTGIVGKVVGFVPEVIKNNNPLTGSNSIGGLVLGNADAQRTQAMQIMVLASALPLAVMSATAILGIIATTAQAFWKIAFEFFKLAPAVAAFAFRPTRGVFATSVKGWISPIMIFAVTYSMLGLSSNVVCNMEVAQTPSGPVTLCNDSEGYVQGIAEAPYDLQAEFREQKEGEAVFPMITKSIWISLAFFTLFINSSLRLAAKMDWVGGGGLADGLQKLVSNTLGNVDHYKAAAGKTGGLASDVAQKAWMESGEKPKKDKDKDKDPNQKEKDENKQEKDEEKKEERKKQNQETDEKNLDNRKAANNINAGRRQRTPVAP
jgi:hypothetical protein